jgi:hypothetical protein
MCELRATEDRELMEIGGKNCSKNFVYKKESKSDNLIRIAEYV